MTAKSVLKIKTALYPLLCIVLMLLGIVSFILAGLQLLPAVVQVIGMLFSDSISMSEALFDNSWSFIKIPLSPLASVFLFSFSCYFCFEKQDKLSDKLTALDDTLHYGICPECGNVSEIISTHFYGYPSTITETIRSTQYDALGKPTGYIETPQEVKGTAYDKTYLGKREAMRAYVEHQRNSLSDEPCIVPNLVWWGIPNPGIPRIVS